jgi:hypothetical protein
LAIVGIWARASIGGTHKTTRTAAAYYYFLVSASIRLKAIALGACALVIFLLNLSKSKSKYMALGSGQWQGKQLEANCKINKVIIANIFLANMAPFVFFTKLMPFRYFFKKNSGMLLPICNEHIIRYPKYAQQKHINLITDVTHIF